MRAPQPPTDERLSLNRPNSFGSRIGALEEVCGGDDISLFSFLSLSLALSRSLSSLASSSSSSSSSSSRLLRGLKGMTAPPPPPTGRAQDVSLSHSLTLSLSHSLTLSPSHSLTLSHCLSPSLSPSFKGSFLQSCLFEILELRRAHGKMPEMHYTGLPTCSCGAPHVPSHKVRSAKVPLQHTASQPKQRHNLVLVIVEREGILRSHITYHALFLHSFTPEPTVRAVQGYSQS